MKRAIVLSLCAVCLCVLCGQATAQEPATLTPEQAMRLIQNLQPGEKREVVISEENAVGVGAGLDVSGQDVDVTKFKADAPEASLGTGKAGAKGGTLDLGFSVLGKEVNWFLLAGIGCLLAAGVAAYFRLFGAAVAASVLAGVLIIGDSNPLLLGVGILAAAGYLVWQGKAGDKAKEALRAVAAGVADLKKDDAAAYAKAKEAVARHADATDVKTIQAVKAKDGL